LIFFLPFFAGKIFQREKEKENLRNKKEFGGIESIEEQQ